MGCSDVPALITQRHITDSRRTEQQIEVEKILYNHFLDLMVACKESKLDPTEPPQNTTMNSTTTANATSITTVNSTSTTTVSSTSTTTTSLKRKLHVHSTLLFIGQTLKIFVKIRIHHKGC